MLLLFETAAGFALFKVLKESKLRDEQVLHIVSMMVLAAMQYKVAVLTLGCSFAESLGGLPKHRLSRKGEVDISRS